MSTIRDDFPVRLTAAEAKALLRAAAEALDGKTGDWAPRTRGALESAQAVIGGALAARERMDELARAAGKLG